MNRSKTFLLVVALVASVAAIAQKTTSLPAIPSIADADLFIVVDDVAGTPTTTKATGTQLKTFIGAGAGDVTKVGTPVNDQIGVWTGDGTLEGDANLIWNGSSLSVGGVLLGQISIDANASTPVAVVAADSGKLFTNEGAAAEVNFNLPTCVAGQTARLYVQDVDGIRATAATGDTIRVGATVSAAAGTINSTTIGDHVELVCINATEWVSIGNTGAWNPT